MGFVRPTTAPTARIRRALSIALVGVCIGAALPAFALEGEEEAAVVEAPGPVEPYAPAHVRDPHDPKRAMHPVRVAAYVLHPVGVVLDWTIVRPAVWVARREPFRTLFGYQD